MIKRKKLIIDNIPVTITIHEEDLTTHEKLLIILDAIKMQIDAEFEEYIANNDKAKTIEYKVLTEYIYNLKKKRKRTNRVRIPSAVNSRGKTQEA